MATSLCKRPLQHISAGTLDLKNTKLVEHSSRDAADLVDTTRVHNAALLVEEQGCCGKDATCKSSATLILDNVTIQSYTGKGISNRAGCNVVMENSQVVTSRNKFW
jgi:hypothetical protein